MLCQKHEISIIMMKLLYYAYVGISSRHIHFAINKPNGPVAIAPLYPNLPRSSPMVDVPNWDDDVFLTPGRDNAPLSSRFTESEQSTTCIVLRPLISYDRQIPRYQFGSIVCPSNPLTQSQRRPDRSFHFNSIHLANCPRFSKPGPSCLPMVNNPVRPSTTLRWKATTIPLLNFDLPILLHILNQPYEWDPFQLTTVPIYSNKKLHHKKLSTKQSPPRTILTMPFKATKARTNADKGSGTKVPPSTTVTMSTPPPETLQMSSAEYSLAKSLQTKSKSHALYPPLGHHPLEATLPFSSAKERSRLLNPLLALTGRAPRT